MAALSLVALLVAVWSMFPHDLRRSDASLRNSLLKKTPQGYQVKAESGKNLSKPNLSKPEAVKRLKQVEYFKHQKKK